MNDIRDILKKIVIPIIIWKIGEKNVVKCYFTNEKISNLNEHTKLNQFIKNNKIEYKFAYDDLLKNNENQYFNYKDKTIIIEKIEKDLFYEMHYPNCTNMLYTVSSKIRKPLTNIISILTLMDKFSLEPEFKKYLEIIKKSSFEIIGIVNDIIDIINLEQNKITLQLENVSIKNLIKETLNIVLNEAKEKKISLNFEVDSKVPSVIIVDKNRLEQIIVSLLNNSIKNTKNGFINLEVSLFNETDNVSSPFKWIKIDNERYNLLFKIKDTGNGISKPNKVIVDNILGIKKNEVTKPYKNCGFGLLISKYLCNLMGGHVWYKSEKDMGTIFYFNIICSSI